MFKYLFILLILISVPATAGVWEKLTTLGQKTYKPTTKYLVEASGWNVRVVEWTPPENKNVRCMFVAGEMKGGVACYSTK